MEWRFLRRGSRVGARRRFGPLFGGAAAPASGRFSERLVEGFAEGRFGAVTDGFGED